MHITEMGGSYVEDNLANSVDLLFTLLYDYELENTDRQIPYSRAACRLFLFCSLYRQAWASFRIAHLAIANIAVVGGCNLTQISPTDIPSPPAWVAQATPTPPLPQLHRWQCLEQSWLVAQWLHSMEVPPASQEERYGVPAMQFSFHFCLGACFVEVAMRQQFGLWRLWTATTIDLTGLVGDVDSWSAQLLPVPFFSQLPFIPSCKHPSGEAIFLPGAIDLFNIAYTYLVFVLFT